MMNEETIVRTYADMVYKIAYRYVANPADADRPPCGDPAASFGVP